MVYQNGPEYRERDVNELKAEIDEAASDYGQHIQTVFFPSGNTIAMETKKLAAICRHAVKRFPNLQRITVYGSSQYIHKKGLDDLKLLKEAGLSRIHVGLESGDDAILRKIKKGCLSKTQVKAGLWVMEAGIELSMYVILGIGGKIGTKTHALETAAVLSRIQPHFIRLRTFVPKVNTALLDDVKSGEFEMLGPHEVLQETRILVSNLTTHSFLTSDHYTNYVNIQGRLPVDREKILNQINTALKQPETEFRSFFIGNQ
jgi:radical SAM superfamily enzyme YgiQ (UPF0313 family)